MAKGLLQVVGVEAEGTLFKVPYTHAGDWRLKVFAIFVYNYNYARYSRNND